MRLVKAGLHILTEEALSPWLAIRDFLRVAAGDETVQLQAAPLVVENQQERSRVVVQVKGLSVEFETAGATDFAERALRVAGGFNRVAAFPRLSFIKQEAAFLEAFDLPFHEVLAALKRRYLADSSLRTSATDLALVFDTVDGNVRKKLQFGPMDVEQLKSEVLRWPPDDLPANCLYLSFGYEVQESAEFSVEHARSVLDDAYDWESATAEAIAAEVRGA